MSSQKKQKLPTEYHRVLTGEAAIGTVTVESALVASAEVKKTALVIGLSASIEAMISPRATAAIAAIVVDEDAIAGCGLLNH